MNKTVAPISALVPNPKYAPRWVSFASRILDELFDGTRSSANDVLTKRVMITSLETLAKGNALSQKQADTFVESIKVRLGKPDFAWTGAIQLTRSQREGARALLTRVKSKQHDAPAPEALQESRSIIAALTERIEVLEAALSEFLQANGYEPAPLLRNSDTNAAETEPFPLETKTFSDLTERNGTKRNHESMISPSVISMKPCVGAHSAANDDPSSTCEKENTVHAAKPERSQNPEGRAAVSYFRNNPAKAPSANLEIGDQCFSLVFHEADLAEDRLRTVCTAEWLKNFEKEVGSVLRDQSRRHSASDLRYVISPLYAAGDRRGLKAPVVADSVAVLQWGANHEPQSVIFLREYNPTVIVLAANPKTKPMSPTHKGSAKLAA